jgi:glycosyltransferase involved in cell wall biosynthesis
MRILISSHLFAPSIGGIEQVSAVLAEEFAACGHAVRVLTQTPAQSEPAAAYDVWRQPDAGRLLAAVRGCDVYLQNNISLATLWPAWLWRRPVVIAHQTWLTQPDGSVGWRERAKHFCTRRARANIAISGAVAAALPGRSVVVPNPYREDVFFADPAVVRERELIFTGRLVGDKGADVLLDALAILHARGVAPRLTIVGGGPDEPVLRARVAGAPWGGRVRFAGVLTGAALRREYAAHEILVVPSRWPEPFGIVALEGAACGCVVVGSQGGGLPEAIGPAGELFPNGDAAALAEVLARLLADPARRRALRTEAPAHLARHRRRAVAERYLEILRGAAGRSS